MKTITKRKVEHPDHRDTYARGHNDLPVVVFERRLWKTPTAEQELDYDIRTKQVVALGGTMLAMRHEMAGKNQTFFPQDIRAMRKAVRKAFPDYIIVGDWNGAGSYTYSVSIMKKEPKMSASARKKLVSK